jgi:hypothetical protein
VEITKKKLRLGKPLSGSRSKARTSRIRNKCANHSTPTLSQFTKIALSCGPMLFSFIRFCPQRSLIFLLFPVSKQNLPSQRITGDQTEICKMSKASEKEPHFPMQLLNLSIYKRLCCSTSSCLSLSMLFKNHHVLTIYIFCAY